MNDDPGTIQDRIEKRREEREKAELQFVLSSPYGRAAMWRLLSLCGLLRASYVRGDTHHTAFHEGQRNIGTQWLMLLDAATPGAFTKMRDEDDVRTAQEELEVSRDTAEQPEE